MVTIFLLQNICFLKRKRKKKKVTCEGGYQIQNIFYSMDIFGAPISVRHSVRYFNNFSNNSFGNNNLVIIVFPYSTE